ncbi:MAG TPA: DUF6494 family protein [Gammaproteobacteria bacterium]|nr:DUF6494 family protein [Gammaproteobacteria bacterium]
MDEEKFNMSLRKFLKTVGVTSQREIEKRVNEALESGEIKSDAHLPVKAVVTLEGLGTVAEVNGEIVLE